MQLTVTRVLCRNQWAMSHGRLMSTVLLGHCRIAAQGRSLACERLQINCEPKSVASAASFHRMTIKQQAATQPRPLCFVSLDA